MDGRRCWPRKAKPANGCVCACVRCVVSAAVAVSKGCGSVSVGGSEENVSESSGAGTERGAERGKKLAVKASSPELEGSAATCVTLAAGCC